MGTDNIHSRKHLKTFRKELRNGATPAERHFWKYLKGKQLDGKKFLRQHSILNFIVDFYCPSERLVIELDGNDHFSQEGIAYDKAQTIALERLNHKVVRFENNYVFEHTESVLLSIQEHFKTIIN